MPATAGASLLAVDQPAEIPSDDAWRAERRKGMLGIAGAVVAATALWYGIRFNAPVLEGMDEPAARLVFALECSASQSSGSSGIPSSCGLNLHRSYCFATSSDQAHSSCP